MRKLRILFAGVRVRITLAALVVSALAMVLPGNGATAQQGQGQFLVEASARLGKLIAQANQDGYIFQDDNFSIGGGWIRQSQTNWVSLYTMNLDAGKRYRFLAAGDADARDVDLDVSDLNGKVLASDVRTDPEAVVNFTPPASGKYLVRVRLYDSDKNLPCLCLAVVLVSK